MPMIFARSSVTLPTAASKSTDRSLMPRIVPASSSPFSSNHAIRVAAGGQELLHQAVAALGIGRRTEHHGGQQLQGDRLLAEDGRVELDRLLVGREHIGHQHAAAGQQDLRDGRRARGGWLNESAPRHNLIERQGALLPFELKCHGARIVDFSELGLKALAGERYGLAPRLDRRRQRRRDSTSTQIATLPIATCAMCRTESRK